MSLQNAILGLLTYRPMSGYDLKQVFDKSINYFWTAQLSQIYRVLGALEGRGYVVSRIESGEGRPDRKVYTITEEGDKAFQRWLEKFPQVLTGPVREEFSMRIFFGSRLSREELTFQLKKYIREKQREIDTCKALAQIIDEYADAFSRPQDKLYWHFTLSKGFIVVEACIKWAEKCLGELSQMDDEGGCALTGAEKS